MTSSPTIIMKFKPGQPVSVEVKGVKGQACKAFSRPFEAVLGGTVISDKPTAEANQMAGTASVQVKA